MVITLTPFITLSQEQTIDNVIWYDSFYSYNNAPQIYIPKDSIGNSQLQTEFGTYFSTNFDNYNELGVYIQPQYQKRLSKDFVFSLQPHINNHNIWVSSSNEIPGAYNGYINFQHIGGKAFIAYEIDDQFEVGAGIYGSYAFSNNHATQTMVQSLNNIGTTMYGRYKNDNFSFTLQVDYTKKPLYPNLVPFREPLLE